MSHYALNWTQFPRDKVVDVPLEDLHSAYFVEHDVRGADVEEGYRRRLKENKEEGIGPGHWDYHPGDKPQAMSALTRSVRKEGVREPLALTFPEDDIQTPTITNGNHRYLAAKRAGLETVPVRRW